MRTHAPIGTTLRLAREERSLSIEETAWRTRIRPDLLRALEEEDFESLGHRAFARRHIGSYARFLGLEPDDVIAAYESRHAHPEPSAIEELDRQRRVSRKPPRAKWLIAGAASAAVLATAAALGVLGGQAESPPPAPPATPRVAGAASRSGVRSIIPEARIRLRIAADRATSLSVFADGRQVFDGMLEPGWARTFRGREDVEIVVADADAVRVRHNGRALGSPGDAGSAWRGHYGPRGPIAD